MVMDSTLNRERAKTCSFHFQGTQSRAKQRGRYHTHLYAQGAASAGTRRGFPSNKDGRVRKQCEVTPISLSRELLTNDLKNA